MPMSDWNYPTAFSHWGREEDEAIDRVRRSGRWTMGPEVETFEAEFAAYHGKKHAVMVNSGSSANLIATAALFAKQDRPLIRQGDENRLGDLAIVPAIAWSTTYAPLVQHGLRLHLADADATWNAPVPDWFPRANLRLIVTCSILGNPGYLQEWRAVADEVGACVIEDNCESFGAHPPDAGNLCGTYGDLNTFSFFYSHQISAIEGGMVLTDDDELARLCRMLRAHGWSRDVEPPNSFDEEYRFCLMAFNVRPLEMHAAIAREQLKKAFDFKVARQQNVWHFRELTERLPITHQVTRGVPSSFGMPFLCPTVEDRARLVFSLREAGIDCRLPTGGSFACHPYGRKWASQATPAADDIHRRGIFLGNAPYPIPDKIERAAAVIKETLA